MKNTIILVLAVLTIAATRKPSVEPTFDLNAALEKGHVDVAITGNPESSHYLKPIIIELKNLKSDPINVRIPNGLQLHAQDVQDVIVTKEEMITLAPNEKTSREVYAMCTQQYLSASNSESTFTVGTLASGDLATLAAEIQRSENYSTLGQYAIWAITDEEPLNTISGFDMEEATRLKTYVANLLEVPVPEYDPENYLTNYHDDGLIKRAITSKFKYRSLGGAKISIAMFDDEDRIVRELYNDPFVSGGEHEFEFKFEAEVYRDKAYFIRMIVDDEIKINMKMEPRNG